MTLIRNLALALFFAVPVVAQTAATPEVGAKAPEIALTSLDGQALKLSSLLAQGEVAVVFLRGYPGYQCPYCQKQVHAFVEDAPKFAARKIQILLVYPGEATTTQATKDQTLPPNTAPLGQRGSEFLAKEGTLPSNIHFVLDPDFKAITLYGLRWDAPHETAYPSTFLLSRKGVVLYRKISHSHGDRATTEEILGAEPAKP